MTPGQAGNRDGGGDADLDRLLAEIRACQRCAADLPLGPRPVLRVAAGAGILLVGQAPGTKVHHSGMPWTDASGERLRDWLAMPPAQFYDETRVAIMPMGFCYPGVDRKGGDKPPRPECAPLWHDRVLAHLPGIRLTLLIGGYAQKRYLGAARKATMTDTVRAFESYLPACLPLPHPSWRNTGWIRRNPWFEADLLPVLRDRVRAIIGGPPAVSLPERL